MPRLNSSLRSQAVPNTARMKTKKTQTNPQSSELRLQTTGLKLLVQLQSEFLHPHGDKGRHHKPSDTNVGTQLGLDSSSSGVSLSFQTLILSEVSLFQTQLLCLEVPESSWTEETAAHLCNKPAAAASPDQESWMRGNVEKVKNNNWFLSNPSVSSPFYTNLGPFELTQAGSAPGALQVMQNRGRSRINSFLCCELHLLWELSHHWEPRWKSKAPNQAPEHCLWSEMSPLHKTFQVSTSGRWNQGFPLRINTAQRPPGSAFRGW